MAEDDDEEYINRMWSTNRELKDRGLFCIKYKNKYGPAWSERLAGPSGATQFMYKLGLAAHLIYFDPNGVLILECSKREED